MEFLPSGNPQIRIWYPPGNMQHKGFHANMVLGHNLHHMAPFSILEAGFCMVFRRASFVFLVPGARFGTPGPKNCPGWAWDLFGAKMGAQKTWFCGRMISPGEITGVPLREMDCMVPRRLLGRLFPPKPTWEISFTGISPFLGKLAWAPGPSLCISYWPYEGPIGAIPYLATRSSDQGQALQPRQLCRPGQLCNPLVRPHSKA